MIKKRPIWGKFTNIHLYIGVLAYVIITGFQIGLPDTFSGTRDILTVVQLVMLGLLSLLVLVNLVRNWE